MDKKDELKKFIIDAIKSNPRANKKFSVLKKGKLGEILGCYRDCCDEYADNLHESVRDYAKEKFLLKDILVKPEGTRDTLKAWLRAEVWCDVVKKFKGEFDKYEFEIKFHEALDELKENKESY